MIKTVATLGSLESRQGQRGEFVTVEAAGKRFAIFDKPLIDKAKEFQGQSVEIGYDEQQKGQYTNRTIRQLVLAADSGDVEVTSQGYETTTPYKGSTNGNSGQSQGDWVSVVTQAALNGEWRAANELARRQDINKSVALNNAVKFMEFMEPKDRVPSNIRLVYESLLGILSGD